MAEYICREAAINAIKSLESSMPAKDNYAKGYDAALGRVLIAVREVSPAADVQPVRHGRWIPQGDYMWLCSNCKENIIYSEHESDRIEKQRYCCKCGARMDAEPDEPWQSE
jgi:hypothetical protein